MRELRRSGSFGMGRIDLHQAMALVKAEPSHTLLTLCISDFRPEGLVMLGGKGVGCDCVMIISIAPSTNPTGHTACIQCL